MGYGGGAGGGSGSISGSSDVALDSLADNQVLSYDDGSKKWTNKTPSTGFAAVSGAKVLIAQDFTTADTARCTSRTDVSVRWRGPVEPANMLVGDEWYVTTA